MKLRNWHIDGFGVFSGAKLPEALGDGLNLIVGPNAAGKSTLLDFLRYTLFGYPSGTSSLPRREPLNGGNHGGSVEYEISAETYTLFRQPTKKSAFELRSKSGTLLTSNDLENHLASVTPEMFRTIFGFSLEEIQGVESIKKPGIRDLVFAASVGRSLRQIRDAQESLDKQASAIYKEAAKPTALNPPRLNKLQFDLARVRKELSQAIEAGRAIAGKQNEIEDETANLAKISNRERSVEADIQRLDRLTQAWPLWVRRYRADEERRSLGNISFFPPDGDSTFVKLETEFQNARAQALARLDGFKDVQESLRRIPIEFSLLKLASKVKELETKKADYEISHQLAAMARSHADNAKQRWQKLEEELGHHWPQTVIRSFDPSLITEDEVRSLAGDIGRADLILSEKRFSASNLARDARTISGECFSKSRQLSEVAKVTRLDEQEVLKQRNMLGAFREALGKYESLGDAMERARDHLTQVNLFTSQREPVRTVSTWLSNALIIIAIGVIGTAVGLFYAGQQISAATIALFGFALIALVLFARFSSPSNVRISEASPELRDAKNRYDSAKNAYDDHGHGLESQAVLLGLSWPTNQGELIELENQITDSEWALNKTRVLSKQLEELRASRRVKNNEFRRERKELISAKQSVALLKERWLNFLNERNFPMVHFETAISILTKVKEARQTLHDLDAYSSEEDKHEQTVQSYLEELSDCLESAGIPPSNSPALRLTQFASLSDEIRLQGELSKRRAELLEQRRLSRRAFQNALRKKRDSRRVLQDLFKKAGVRDDEDFRNLSERFKRDIVLTQEIREMDTGLETIFGKNQIPNELGKALNPGPRPDWEIEQSALRSERDSLKNQREDSFKRRTSLELEVNAELKSDVLARLQLEAEELEEEIRQGIEEWLDLATSQELLRRTRKKFELENQTPALAEASRLFKLVTDGCYEKIIVPLDSEGSDLAISSQTPPSLTPKQLSRGTLEQLYLCIRLGYIRHFQKQRSQSLPLLMDDVAVNFDPQRMVKTFEVLSDCCRAGQQILFFTCHYDLVKLLRPGDRCFVMKDFQFERRAIGPLVSTNAA